MRNHLLAAIDLDTPPYRQYWKLIIDDIDLANAYLLVTYPPAAPAPDTAFGALYAELLDGLGAQPPVPGSGLLDFLASLDWTLPDGHRM